MNPNNMIQKHLKYFKRKQEELDAHQTKASLITTRNEWMKKQKVNNYKTEYDRVRAEIENSVVKGQSIESLKKRKKELEQLMKESV